ncbi:type II inositol 3,4-bisphosphate 4-phosphatase-like protein [Lates japonicus]|uniref:Type II inositol 3,4-bisphosphate 4-phosphatase-like protein n=1 Tax=Lates japonicus TaxID=270547 RepID=A0AAD3NB78_LATJO|nr:type II inositol 3,4-bisphosphate 4-phosphatase-like protein [Lates japonicus]
MDGVNEVGEVKVSRLQMEGDGDDKTPPEHKCPALCDSLHSSVHDKENSPMMRAVLCSQVCKVYRFQTEDQRWLLVREQLSETPLSFSLPKQLLSALILRAHKQPSSYLSSLRIQGGKEPALSPHWMGPANDVINHCNYLIGCYQEATASSCQTLKEDTKRTRASGARSCWPAWPSCSPSGSSGHEELLSASGANTAHCSSAGWPDSADGEQFVHRDFKDEAGKSLCWRQAWANALEPLNCIIIAMVDRLQGRESILRVDISRAAGIHGDTNSFRYHRWDVVSSSFLLLLLLGPSWQEQLLQVTLRLRPLKGKARAAMTLSSYRGAWPDHRIDPPVVCEFHVEAVSEVRVILSLQQLLSVGVLAQFESSSTHGNDTTQMHTPTCCRPMDARSGLQKGQARGGGMLRTWRWRTTQLVAFAVTGG